MSTEPAIEDVLRRCAPDVLGALVRGYGDFGAAEDACQEALLAGATQWPTQGRPDNPTAWLIRVGSRRLIDQLRSESATKRREENDAEQHLTEKPSVSGRDDTLTLLMLCCHPSLTAPSQIALTMRAVGGLTTAEIAGAFLVPESTMAQRISRAKQRIRTTGAEFVLPPAEERADRLRSVLHVLYLIFNEGYTVSSGPDLQRGELTAEAIRLTRSVRELLPDDGEVVGLLALMLLTEARRPARTRTDGSLVPLAEQDRSTWDRRSIEEGTGLITEALSRHRVGPYQLQAAIAAVHSEAASSEDTDWPQIVELYRLLDGAEPNPMVTLNLAVAVAMADGPSAGLAMLETVAVPLDRHHRLHAVRGHLLELSGRYDIARAAYDLAARLTTSLPEQRYLREKAESLAHERD